MARGFVTPPATRSDWATPPALFRRLHEEFKFDLDACASDWNCKLGEFVSLETDSLSTSWTFYRRRDRRPVRAVWLNPPYGDGPHMRRWMRKAAIESWCGLTVVCLIHARTCTEWWHNWVMPFACELRLFRGRIWFENENGPRSPAGAPSVLVVYRPGVKGPPALTTMRVSRWG
ncbi:MAG: DNA N-6-adenine-methyltransferase [Methyloligellaceae bacterium]